MNKAVLFLRKRKSQNLLLVLMLSVAVFTSISSCKKNIVNEDDILKYCKEINENLATYQLKSMDGYPEPEKSKINAYYKGELLKLIIEEYYTDTCRTFTNYYINKNELIYVYKEKYLYNKPVYYTQDSAKALNDTVWYDDKKTVLKTDYYYFANDKLKKWVNNQNKTILATDITFTQQQDELLGNCMFIMRMLKGKEEE